MNLPIDRVSESGPLRFRWWQIVGTPGGNREVEQEGPLSNSADQAVAILIEIAKHAIAEVEALREKVRQMEEASAVSQRTPVSTTIEEKRDTRVGRRK